MKLGPILLRGTILILIAVIGFSIYRLSDIYHNYAQEVEMRSRIQQYSPALQGPVSSATHEVPAAMVNQNIIDLQAKYPDVAGWLTIPNTKIDYPFAQSNDNDYYLHMNLDRNWSAAGTIFMDYRNSRDFSGFNTIIFGHNMRNGSMFGTLQNFSDRDFFDANTTGTIFLPDKTYEIEFIAFAVVRHDDAIIYNPNILAETDKIAFLDHIEKTARHYRDVGITTNDSIITLSTCNYEFNDARMVIIGRILPRLF